MSKSLRILWILLAAGLLWPVRAVWADSLPEDAQVEGVLGHAQAFSLSCESRSAADWAAYWGVYIDESRFLKNLPRSDNPDAGFVGNPKGAWGQVPPRPYGVHAEPVAAALRTYGLAAQAHKGLGWEDLRAEIAAGRPVIVW
ncbi:MAG TPA: C39 family peptidase, partial [Anaerolineales bacterium]|nr:C39 family peptidase [Anaerolineales bacterium]